MGCVVAADLRQLRMRRQPEAFPAAMPTARGKRAGTHPAPDPRTAGHPAAGRPHQWWHPPVSLSIWDHDATRPGVGRLVFRSPSRAGSRTMWALPVARPPPRHHRNAPITGLKNRPCSAFADIHPTNSPIPRQAPSPAPQTQICSVDVRTCRNPRSFRARPGQASRLPRPRPTLPESRRFGQHGNAYSRRMASATARARRREFWLSGGANTPASS